MIRRSTWIVLLVLAAVVGFSLYLKDQQSKAAARPTPTESSSALFPASDGSPTNIKIVASAGNLVEIGRDQAGTWVVKAPLSMAADQAGAEAAATQVTGLRVLAKVQLGLDIVGLNQPSDTLTVTFSSGKTHTLLVGSVTPIQNGYYSQLDGGPVIVVDKPGMDALLGMLTSPPYVATLTPVASETPSAAPVTQTPAPTSAPNESPTAADATATAAPPTTPSVTPLPPSPTATP